MSYRLYPELSERRRQEMFNPKLKVGDQVRTVLKKGIFGKSSSPQFSDEIFSVKAIVFSVPPRYRIVDVRNHVMYSTYYFEQLKKYGN